MSVSAENIRKTFGDYVALDNVSLRVPSGKLTALLGPSGSGKTTLLRIIAGLEFADPGSGVICFDDVDVSAVPAGKRQVGFVFQHYALFRHMTVFDNIAFGLRVRKKNRPPKHELRDRVMRLLKLVQLEGYHDRLPSQLSGGQRQRVALARAIAVEPKVLLLDEPFGALDAKVRKELRRWLRRFHEEVHLTTIFVTHDQEEALEIADEVVIMNNARIEQSGSPQEVYDHPATPFVYEFLGNVNRISLPSHGFESAAAFGTNGDRVAYVRPHDIEVLPYAPDAEGELAVVRAVHAAGPVARISCERTHRVGEIIEVELPRSKFKDLELAAGSVVALRVRHGREFTEDFSI